MKLVYQIGNKFITYSLGGGGGESYQHELAVLQAFNIQILEGRGITIYIFRNLYLTHYETFVKMFKIFEEFIIKLTYNVGYQYP